MNVSTIWAPALAASSESSSSDSSVRAAARRADSRFHSTPTRIARSGAGLLLAMGLRLRLVMDGNTRCRRASGGPYTGGGGLRAAGVGVRRLLRHHRGDGVLEDELLLIVRFEDQGVLVETLDTAGELHAAHQVNSQDDLVLPSVVQKTVLNI